MVPWLITAISVSLLVILWLFSVKKQIAPLYEAVQGADKQARLYWGLLMEVCEDFEKGYMQERYDECRKTYEKQAILYDEMLEKIFIRPAAWLLGFIPAPKELKL